MDEAGTFSTAADPRTLERDEELALEARSDPQAFGVLYQRHRLAVFRYLRTRTANEDDAAELTAIAFERALTAMPRYRSSGGGVLAWLLRIARNAAIDAGRRTSTVPMLADLADERASSSPEAAVLDAERHAALAEAVNRLPDVQREALALRYAAGLTAREIGAVLGKSEQATQKLMSRALATLREEHRHDR
jgi:RNA polymerase sigma-70 factor, ECF subfamily